MKKNQKIMMSAATLAVLATSFGAGCSSQSQQASVPADDTDVPSTVATDIDNTDDVSTTVVTATDTGTYTDGTYTGSAASTRWGDVQVSVVIQDGAIADVQFLTYPDGDTRSAQINAQATGMLVQEAIQVQSADVQVISGATFTSEAFILSLDSALSQAV